MSRAGKQQRETEAAEKLSLHSLGEVDDSLQPLQLTWRVKLSRLMAINTVQCVIVTLVIIDSLVIVTGLLLEMGVIVIPEKEPHKAVPNNDDNVSHLVTNNNFGHTLSTANEFSRHGAKQLSASVNITTITITPNISSSVDNLCVEGGQNDKGHATPNKHMTELVLHITSLTILTVFVVEIILKFFAEGTHLLKQKVEVFDAVVVLLSFAIDVAFFFFPVGTVSHDYIGLIVLLRLWRVVRIINGITLSVRKDAEKRIRVQIALRDMALRSVQNLTEKVEELKRVNKSLQQHVANLEGRRGSAWLSGSVKTGHILHVQSCNSFMPFSENDFRSTRQFQDPFIVTPPEEGVSREEFSLHPLAPLQRDTPEPNRNQAISRSNMSHHQPESRKLLHSQAADVEDKNIP